MRIFFTKASNPKRGDFLYIVKSVPIPLNQTAILKHQRSYLLPPWLDCN